MVITICSRWNADCLFGKRTRKKRENVEEKPGHLDDIIFGVNSIGIGVLLHKQKRSTEGCSKFKSPETRQVQERLVHGSHLKQKKFVGTKSLGITTS